MELNSPPAGWSRREWLQALLALPLAALPGCSRRPTFAGEIVGASMSLGHRVREVLSLDLATLPVRTTDVLIAGGGLSGLSAAWRLQQAGVTDLTVMDVEPRPGGTASCGRSDLTGYPWGAHYVPAPTAKNPALLQILKELGAVTSGPDHSAIEFDEQALCREPEERLFMNGYWHEGLFPEDEATDQDHADFERFQSLINDWIRWRDAEGKRAWTLPTRMCSQAEQVQALDRISMADWLDQHNIRSSLVRWIVDYSCRDDYGTDLKETSAWAGLFYFVSRRETPEDESAPLLTWPEGLGKISSHLAQGLHDRLLTGTAVLKVEPLADGSGCQVVTWSESAQRYELWKARSVILAVPQFVVPYLIPSFPDDRKQASKQFQYGSWLVANIHLTGRPKRNGFEAAWDNVILDSRSLGYVTATHQSGRDHGPTVWTWYLPLCHRPAVELREWLAGLSWEQAVQLVLTDLTPVHPDLTSLISRIDVMKWGHAMVRSAPGFITNPARQLAATPWNGIHFAGTDLSGIPLCEEAIDHGVRAAEAILSERNIAFTSLRVTA